MATITDLVPNVISKLENRDNSIADAERWIRDALIEVTSSTDFRDDFDELEVLGPTFNLTVATQDYSFSNIIPSGDLSLGTLDIVMWFDPPTNLVRRKLRQSHYQEVDKFNSIQSAPITWFRFGNNVGFSPIPDKAYQVQARVLREHPIDGTLGDTTILLSRDWHEVLEWAAVERGYLEILEFDKAAMIHTMLHGDPKDPTSMGLMKGRKKRRERENWRHEQALRPVVRSYGWGSYGR